MLKIGKLKIDKRKAVIATVFVISIPLGLLVLLVEKKITKKSNSNKEDTSTKNPPLDRRKHPQRRARKDP
ncbi:MAG TPA: hypothetical protein VK145_02960 [Candidatus Nanoarchaeia archaeon]|nr:hypothetical protein [Candidatus Nanoarchaeia archaeon]